MNFLKNFSVALKIFLNARITFAKPKHKKIVIFDTDLSDFIIKYFDKKNVHILGTRFKYNKGEELNLYILLKMILIFKFSSREYFKIYLNIVKPTLIVTLIDNTKIFYELKGFYPKAKTMIIQNAHRSNVKGLDIFAEDIEGMRKNENYMCDYMLTYNQKVGDKYKFFLKGEVVPIGSFKSNSIKINNKNKIYDFLFISNYKKNHQGYASTLENYIKFFSNIKKYCYEKKCNITVLGTTGAATSAETKNEFFFFKKIFDKIEYNFIPRTKNRKTYEICDQSKIILNIDSSLGYESVARGNKVAFFSINNRVDDPERCFHFGWPSKKDKQGPFWTDNTSYDEFIRIVNFLEQINEVSYKDLLNKELHNIIEYDRDNTKFISLMKNLKIPLNQDVSNL